MNGYWIAHEGGLVECEQHGYWWEEEDTESECYECARDDWLEDKADGRVFG